LKFTKFDFGWAPSQIPLGELTALPKTSSWIQEVLLLKRRRRERGKREVEKQKRRKGGQMGHIWTYV